jgi:hypothetical protein
MRWTSEMRALLPPPDAPADAFPAAFDRIAALMLQRVSWHVAGQRHRFEEIEVYYRGGAHDDPFVHGDPRQSTFGQWYFHRTGGTLRGGTFKGLDLTFGGPGVAAGILVRGVSDANGVRIHGPCRVVHHLLACCGVQTVAELDARWHAGAEPDPAEDGPSFLTVEGVARAVAVYASPRVGLTLKRGDTPARRDFLARPYRFSTQPPPRRRSGT